MSKVTSVPVKELEKVLDFFKAQNEWYGNRILCLENAYTEIINELQFMIENGKMATEGEMDEFLCEPCECCGKKTANLIETGDQWNTKVCQDCYDEEDDVQEENENGA